MRKKEFNYACKLIGLFGVSKIEWEDFKKE